MIGDGGADKHTLAHELTHVIQQRQGPVAGTDHGGFRVSDPSDACEKAAEANAARVMRTDPFDAYEKAAGANAAQVMRTQHPVLQRMKVAGSTDPVDLTILDSPILREMLEQMDKEERTLTAFPLNSVLYEPEGGDYSAIEGVLVERRGLVSPALLEWMQSPTSQPSGYGRRGAGPSKVRQVEKDDVEMACWNWAVAALTGTGPSYGDFWDVLHGEASNKPWYTDLSDEVKAEIGGITERLQRDELIINPFDPSFDPSKDWADKKETVRPVMVAAARSYVRAHGLTVVDEAEAAAWVVCQYKPSEGAAGPEHWWDRAPAAVAIVQW